MGGWDYLWSWHVVRRPINGMLGILQLLQGTYLDQEQKDYGLILLDLECLLP